MEVEIENISVNTHENISVNTHENISELTGQEDTRNPRRRGRRPGLRTPGPWGQRRWGRVENSHWSDQSRYCALISWAQDVADHKSLMP